MNNRCKLRPEKQRNATCRRMIFQGTPTTKIFQAKENDSILDQEPDYQFWNGFFEEIIAL